ncbi:hypothetical protein C5167_045551 [Papaver somniferum]|uniref:Glycosyltransferase n=1 Tax=Papaver somniferum TaxID=3469 RepID=A0A4Y7LB83_PAPSO|nr:hypothetical protein C5167_045551 [Papaver somniferum]
MYTQQQQPQEEDDGHIIMFLYMAQGHITRFLALARFISQRKPTTKITFVSTPLNIRRFQSAFASDTTVHSNICLAELPFSCADHGLPANSDNTDSLPSHLISTLLCASETLKPCFDNLMNDIVTAENRVPDCIIADSIFGWVNDTAKRVGTFHFTFVGGALGGALFSSICLHLPHRKNDDSNDVIEEFHVPNFHDSCRLHISQLPVHLKEATKESPHVKFIRKQLSLSMKSDGILRNSVREIEVAGRWKPLRTESKPVWTVGPLLPASFLLQGNSNVSVVPHSRTGKEFGISPESCIEWLNLHKPYSVVYISFGSESSISASKLMELALGLEKSGKCFIWVLRPPSEFDIKSEFKWEWLPEGFVERMNETKKGLLVKKWAPQLEILSHRSTGAFLSHCGWNSVLESLSQGVPIIGWPLGGEQAFNSLLMEEEMGVSVQLANGNEAQVDTSEDVRKAVEQVMDTSKGEEMRKKAMVIAQKISAAMREDEGGHQKGSSVKSIDDFLASVTSKKVVV